MTRLQYWTVTTVAAACFLAMLANLALGLANQSARADVGQRQQYVQQSVQLEGLYREIIRALAELAARNNDGDVKAMLQRHGITFNVNPAAAAPAPAAARK
ncbi:hypothetical protein [Ideonella sp. A 288]|uniref:hypothetical protein n=1 Tax=Ideonella sp. A 288 TaxID=1962181 RepID=UPI000B4AF7C5|nr:hypothetical protein [Ideonella sp. A 288]